MTSADGFSDALIEGVENLFGMDDAIQAMILAYENAAIKPTMDAVAGFNHRAPAGKGGVVADDLKLGAFAAGRVGIQAYHLS